MISVEGLTKRYGDVLAVDNLSFQIKPGVVTGFLGPNGAGKSTTMRMILGLDRPTAGTATINGKGYRQHKKPLHEVGALLDAKAVHPNRTARAQLQWIAAANGISKRRVEEVLDIVGLTEVAGKKAGGFSLGMGQRLGLATALLGDPHTILLDEPVNGLDPEGIHWVRAFMRRLADEGRTVLISSHLLSEMAQTADNLIVIGRGKLISDTSTASFIKENSGSLVHVRSEYLKELSEGLKTEGISFSEGVDDEGRPRLIIADRQTDEIGLLAYSLGIPLTELSLMQASLEDAFLQSTGDSVQYITRVEEERK
ncbi:ABC transporter ATP-binding protein [Corynebacterium caspium]|uniref:ABC transporter ATP-binding protein n=1 Tax=Corynebacterium caspium TaxID=234828 RepID=UPI0004766190|nr:ABC transporter ATP-binding protein [Corynebacterium caspium]WKD58665.1 putative ABC transporter ATP-binding protein YxlF [Corynebacterium caspium DSM 44850]